MKSWLSFKGPVYKAPSAIKYQFAKKCPEVMRLADYTVQPRPSFWDTFPEKDLPLSVVSKINHGALEKTVELIKDKLLPCQWARAQKVIEFLKNGAPSYQKGPLPACVVKNASATFKHGEIITDTVASWLKKGFVAGPFTTPPVSNFRVNSLLAIVNHDKIRPVLNVSLPEGLSFNSNISANKLEQVHMSSPRLFGYSVVKQGYGSTMSKFDWQDAYKNMPARTEDYRLQGFAWLGKYFVELTQIFGAKSAVTNYDILGKTVSDMACVISESDTKKVHRQLDDNPFVSASKEECVKFSACYRELCSVLNIGLAPNCKNLEKAFENEKFGKVLGIWFNTENLTWSFPEDKREETLVMISSIITTVKVSLLELQKLVGKLNHVSLMCPFLKGYRKNLNLCLSEAQFVCGQNFVVPDAVKRDLMVWAGFLSDKERELPIPHEPCNFTIWHKQFYSDAAGFADSAVWDGKVGVACVGIDEDGRFMMAHQNFWDEQLIKFDTDNNGIRFGNKTSFLEFVGIVIPLLLIPEKLRNQHIVFEVDNISCCFGWENRFLKEDSYTSVLIRAAHLISYYLGSTIHVEHRLRNSSWGGKMVDRMSRERTTERNDIELLRSYKNHRLPKLFTTWLHNPIVDWELPENLLNIVESMNK